MTPDWPMKLHPGTFPGGLPSEVAKLQDECGTAGGIFAITEGSLPKSESLTQRKAEPRNEEKEVPDDIVRSPAESQMPWTF